MEFHSITSLNALESSYVRLPRRAKSQQRAEESRTNMDARSTCDDVSDARELNWSRTLLLHQSTLLGAHDPLNCVAATFKGHDERRKLPNVSATHSLVSFVSMSSAWSGRGETTEQVPSVSSPSPWHVRLHA